MTFLDPNIVASLFTVTYHNYNAVINVKPHPLPWAYSGNLTKLDIKDHSIGGLIKSLLYHCPLTGAYAGSY